MKKSILLFLIFALFLTGCDGIDIEEKVVATYPDFDDAEKEVKSIYREIDKKDIDWSTDELVSFEDLGIEEYGPDEVNKFYVEVSTETMGKATIDVIEAVDKRENISTENIVELEAYVNALFNNFSSKMCENIRNYSKSEGEGEIFTKSEAEKYIEDTKIELLDLLSDELENYK